MFDITKQFICQCSLTLGQFDSESVNLLVTLFHYQSSWSQLALLSPDLKRKFENLLTCTTDDDDDNDDDKNNDTPLTRIELAIMIYFKEKFLANISANNNGEQSKHNLRWCMDDELNLAYCFLLARIDDCLSMFQLGQLAFLLSSPSSATSLFQIYENLGDKFPDFFSRLLECGYFAKYLVAVEMTIRNFQVFISRYEDFLVTFAQFHQPVPNDADHLIQTDTILTQKSANEISLYMVKLLSSNREQTKSSAPTSPDKVPNSPTNNSAIQPLVSSSSNVPQKALCVIINISKFTSTESIGGQARAGSDKDVNLIKIVFNKLNFTILECRHDFKEDELYQALDHVNDRTTFGHFDCLVIFIMSHGLLHSFFTADSKEVIIRDIVTRFADSSANTIWTGKPRLFFIQACRSLRSDDISCSNQQGIHRQDLSRQMLIAYSCSPSEASKRSPKSGSIFIQVLCMMLLQYSHDLHIQSILDWTEKFVVKRDEYVAECKRTPLSIQRPQYIEREFNFNFRFSNECLYNHLYSWSPDKQVALRIPLSIWNELYDLLCRSNSSRRASNI